MDPRCKPKQRRHEDGGMRSNTLGLDRELFSCGLGSGTAQVIDGIGGQSRFTTKSSLVYQRARRSRCKF